MNFIHQPNELQKHHRILLVGFDKQVVLALNDLGCGPILWVRKGKVLPGEERVLATKIIDIGDIQWLNFQPVDPRNLDLEEIETALSLLRHMFSRAADRTKYFSPASSWLGQESRMRLMLYYFSKKLDQFHLDTVIFSCIPHTPAALALEALCRARGIDTLMTLQSPFPNRFFIFRELAELGELPDSAGEKHSVISLPKKPSRPFYMKKTIAMRKQALFLRPLRHSLQMMLRFLLLPIGGSSRKFYKSLLKAFYARETRRLHTVFFSDKPDLNADFVYCPLHLQPELTVDVMGDRFGDQALMVETLAKHAPEGWLVYVKENPKQTAKSRPEEFFQRLRALPNVCLIRSDVDTFELIKSAQCVATCTGTAGWEALLLGKPAIAFGVAWWRKLPGAYEWRNDLQLSDIANTQHTREDLEGAVCRLATTMKEGVVDPYFSRLVEKFDSQHNGKLVAHGILSQISQQTNVAK